LSDRRLESCMGSNLNILRNLCGGICHQLICFFPSRKQHTRFKCDWSSDVCSSDLNARRTRSSPRCPCRAEAERARHPEERRAARSEERRVGKEWGSRGGPNG